MFFVISKKEKKKIVDYNIYLKNLNLYEYGQKKMNKLISQNHLQDFQELCLHQYQYIFSELKIENGRNSFSH